jgi:hypothetical protein
MTEPHTLALSEDQQDEGYLVSSHSKFRVSDRVRGCTLTNGGVVTTHRAPFRVERSLGALVTREVGMGNVLEISLR